MTRLKGMVLALAACLVGCNRGGQSESGAGELFQEVDAGLKFTHRNGASGKFYMTEIMGSGVALFDYDNDGDLDVFLVQSVGQCKLFRNELQGHGAAREGRVTFTD